MATEGKVVRREEAETVLLPGTRVACLVGGRDSQHCSLIEFRVEPGCGSGVHYRTTFEEVFYVLEGDVRFVLGGSEVVAGPGTAIVAPAGCPHGYGNEGTAAARMLMITMPGGYEQYFGKVAELIGSQGAVDAEAVGALRRQYDTVQLSPPRIR